MALPPGVNERDFTTALREFERAVGAEWVFTRDEDVALYRDAYSPVQGEDLEKLVSAAVAPESTEQVQAVVRTANRYRIPIYPISTGKNLGYGGSAPNLSGSVVLDLKRMNRVIEVDDKRHFAIVEPGVSYFDLYRYIQERKLKVWIDTRIPAGAASSGIRSITASATRTAPTAITSTPHCGMEVVLPNGELMRTGMGALPDAATSAEYRYGFGPYVDGLFSQGNFGVVTKMGFWLLPEPEAYLSGTVTVPGRNDIVELVEIVNKLEHMGLIGMPNYGTPLQAQFWNPAGGGNLAAPFAQAARDLERWAQNNGTGYYTCELQFYGPKETVRANWDYAQRLLKGDSRRDASSSVRSSNFRSRRTGPRACTKSRSGFRTSRSSTSGADKAPKCRAGTAKFGSRRSFRRPARPFSRHKRSSRRPSAKSACRRSRIRRACLRRGCTARSSSSWGCPSRGRMSLANQRLREAFMRLANAGAAHGWGEYRTPPIFQDLVMSQYSFNDHASRRFSETLEGCLSTRTALSRRVAAVFGRDTCVTLENAVAEARAMSHAHAVRDVHFCSCVVASRAAATRG